ISSDWRKLSASAPTMRSLTGGCPSGEILKSSPTARCSTYINVVWSAIAATAPSSNVRFRSSHALASSSGVLAIDDANEKRGVEKNRGSGAIMRGVVGGGSGTAAGSSPGRSTEHGG